jgi:hypothetical protein
MNRYLGFQNSGASEFGNAAGGGGTDAESWSNGYIQGTQPIRVDVSRLSITYPEVTSATLTMTNANVLSGDSVFRSIYLRPGETLSGALVSIQNSNSGDTTPADLDIACWVTGETSTGTSCQWGSPDIGLFSKDVIAKGTNIVPALYSTAFATTGTVLFETPVTVSQGTNIYLHYASDLDTVKVARQSSQHLNTLIGGGTSHTYGTTSLANSASIPLALPLISPYRDLGGYAHINTSASGTSVNMANSSTYGAYITDTTITGTVSNIYANIDVDYDGLLLVLDSQGNMIGTSLPILTNYPATSSNALALYPLQEPIRITKNTNYIITGTSNNATGNPSYIIQHYSPFTKSFSPFANSSLVQLTRSDLTYTCVGTSLLGSPSLYFVFSTIEVAQ